MECGAEKNPPVTALPCQPPLGKGALGTGEADCHDQFANWSRNDTFQEMRCEDGRRLYGGQAGMMAFLFRMICPISFTAG